MNIAGNYPITQQYFCILGGFGVLVKFGAIFRWGKGRF